MNHPLDGDGVTFALFAALAKANKRLESARVNVAPTVAFESGFAKAWFSSQRIGDFHVPDGTTPNRDRDRDHDNEGYGGTREVKKRSGKDIDLEQLYRKFTHGTKDNQIVAQFLNTQRGFVSVQPHSSTAEEVEPPSVQLFDKKGLKDWLFNNFKKPNGILQKFIYPKGNYNTVIQAIWSPKVALFGCRRNKNNLYENNVPMFERSFTFEVPNMGDEDSPATTLVSMTEPMQMKVHQACNTIASHFAQTDHLHITRMLLYFKVDQSNVLRLLYSTSIRVIRKAKHASLTDLEHLVPSQPLNLSLRLAKKKTAQSEATEKKQEREMQFFDETAQQLDHSDRAIAPTSMVSPTKGVPRREQRKATHSIRLDQDAVDLGSVSKFFSSSTPATSTRGRTLYSDTCAPKKRGESNRPHTHKPPTIHAVSALNNEPHQNKTPSNVSPTKHSSSPHATSSVQHSIGGTKRMGTGSPPRSPAGGGVMGPPKTNQKLQNATEEDEMKQKTNNLMTLFNSAQPLSPTASYLPDRDNMVLTTSNGKKIPKKEKEHLVKATEVMRTIWQPNWQTEAVLHQYQNVLPDQFGHNTGVASNVKKERGAWEKFLHTQREWMTKNGYYQYLDSVNGQKKAKSRVLPGQSRIQNNEIHQHMVEHALVHRFQPGQQLSYRTNPLNITQDKPQEHTKDQSKPSQSSGTGTGTVMTPSNLAANSTKQAHTMLPGAVTTTSTRFGAYKEQPLGLVSIPKQTVGNLVPQSSYPSPLTQAPRLPYPPLPDFAENVDPEDLEEFIAQMSANPRMYDGTNVNAHTLQYRNVNTNDAFIKPGRGNANAQKQEQQQQQAPGQQQGHATTQQQPLAATDTSTSSLNAEAAMLFKRQKQLGVTNNVPTAGMNINFLSSLPALPPSRSNNNGQPPQRNNETSTTTTAAPSHASTMNSTKDGKSGINRTNTVNNVSNGNYPNNPTNTTSNNVTLAPLTPNTQNTDLNAFKTSVGSGASSPTRSATLPPTVPSKNTIQSTFNNTTSSTATTNGMLINEQTAIDRSSPRSVTLDEKYQVPRTPPEVASQLLLARHVAPKDDRQQLQAKLGELKLSTPLPDTVGSEIEISEEERETLNALCSVLCWDCMEFIQELLYDVYSYFLSSTTASNNTIQPYYYEIPRHLETILDDWTIKRFLRKVHPELTTVQSYFLTRVGTPPWIKKSRPPTRDLTDKQYRQRQVQRFKKEVLGKVDGSENEETTKWRNDQLNVKRSRTIEARMDGPLKRWPLPESAEEAGRGIVIRPLEKMMDVLRGASQDILDDTLPSLLSGGGVYQHTLHWLTNKYMKEKEVLYEEKLVKLQEEERKKNEQKALRQEKKKKIQAEKAAAAARREEEHAHSVAAQAYF